MKNWTLSDALKNGYTLADCTFQRGYISRKADASLQPVHVAGGSRKGQLYVLLPCWQSTTYCYRQYLKKA